MAGGGVVGGNTVDSSKKIMIANMKVVTEKPDVFVDKLMTFAESVNVDILNP